MARTASDLGTPTTGTWPVAGKHDCKCVGAEKARSQKKKTPFVKLTFRTIDGVYEFTDDAYVVPKCIKRLNLIAQRLCAMPETTEIPEDDEEATKFLGNYILKNAPGKMAIINIEENTEEYMVENGPESGTKKKVKRKRVAFGGYESLSSSESDGDDFPAEAFEKEDGPDADGDVPF